MAEETKPDLERIGLFKEMGYLHGEPYVTARTVFNESAHKSKQMTTSCSKMPCATQDGYFQKEFVRIFEGEAYTDPIGLRRRFQREQFKKTKEAIFKPTSGPKDPCGKGTYYGTFVEQEGKPVEHFDAIARDTAKVLCPAKNVLVNPTKKGGYGYTNLTITPAPPYFLPGEYERLKDTPREPMTKKGDTRGKIFYRGMAGQPYFDPNPFRTVPGIPTYGPTTKEQPLKVPFYPPTPAKKDGGMKAGCLSKYPKHMEGVYTAIKGPVIKDVVNSSGKKFLPIPGVKPYPIQSIINTNVKKSVNTDNCKSIKGVVYCSKY